MNSKKLLDVFFSSKVNRTSRTKENFEMFFYFVAASINCKQMLFLCSET